MEVQQYRSMQTMIGEPLATEAGVSGRPDHVTCRLVIDCMVRPRVPQSSSTQYISR